MLDVAPTELLLVAAVAVIVIGPKDLPKAMRFAGHWVGKARGVARQFRQGFDDMVREAEFKEMEKKWAEDNARIMREFPTAEHPPAALPAPDDVRERIEPDGQSDAMSSDFATTPQSTIRDEPAVAGQGVQPGLFDPPAPDDEQARS